MKESSINDFQCKQENLHIHCLFAELLHLLATRCCLQGLIKSPKGSVLEKRIGEPSSGSSRWASTSQPWGCFQCPLRQPSFLQFLCCHVINNQIQGLAGKMLLSKLKREKNSIHNTTTPCTYLTSSPDRLCCCTGHWEHLIGRPINIPCQILGGGKALIYDPKTR